MKMMPAYKQILPGILDGMSVDGSTMDGLTRLLTFKNKFLIIIIFLDLLFLIDNTSELKDWN